MKRKKTTTSTRRGPDGEKVKRNDFTAGATLDRVTRFAPTEDGMNMFVESVSSRGDLLETLDSWARETLRAAGLPETTMVPGTQPEWVSEHPDVGVKEFFETIEKFVD